MQVINVSCHCFPILSFLLRTTLYLNIGMFALQVARCNYRSLHPFSCSINNSNKLLPLVWWGRHLLRSFVFAPVFVVIVTFCDVLCIKNQIMVS